MTQPGQPGIERMPPQGVETEQAVLGAMLMSTKAILTARSMLENSSFYHLPHGIIFEAIVEVYKAEGACDQLMVASYLRGTDSLDLVGGVVYLAKLSAEVATAANISYHCGIVREMATLRWLIELCGATTRKAYDRDAAEQMVEGMVEALLTRTTVREHRGSLMPEIGARVEVMLEAARKLKRRWAGLDCGFPAINDALNGLCEDELTILAARPGIGKTRLMLQIVMGVVRKNPRVWVLIFSLEMTAEQLYQYWACMLAGLDLARFKRGQITDAEYEHYRRARVDLDSWPVIIDDTPALNIEKMYSCTERHAASHKIKLVCLDYLQIMDGKGDGGNEKFDIITKGMKDYKKRYHCHLLPLSQLSRAVEARHDRKPIIADLRDSGAIEQNADNVLMIYRPGAYEHLRTEARQASRLDSCVRQVEIRCEKLRFGPPGTVHLSWLPERAIFAPLTEQAPEEGWDHEHYAEPEQAVLC